MLKSSNPKRAYHYISSHINQIGGANLGIDNRSQAALPLLPWLPAGQGSPQHRPAHGERPSAQRAEDVLCAFCPSWEERSDVVHQRHHLGNAAHQGEDVAVHHQGRVQGGEQAGGVRCMGQDRREDAVRVLQYIKERKCVAGF